MARRKRSHRHHRRRHLAASQALAALVVGLTLGVGLAAWLWPRPKIVAVSTASPPRCRIEQQTGRPDNSCLPATSYVNPLIQPSAPDPEILKVGDQYYVYASNPYPDGPGAATRFPVWRSTDLIHWTVLGAALAATPDWMVDTPGRHWAPQVIKKDGRYLMYFTGAKLVAGQKRQVIGVAESDRPDGNFIATEQPVIEDAATSLIDPMVVFSDSRFYIFWTTSQAIYGAPLTSDGFHLDAPGQTLLSAAGSDFENLVEGPYIWPHQGDFYLFYSGDNQAQHYRLMVARRAMSGGILGTYERGPGPVMESNLDWLNPGHSAVFSDSAGRDWLIYHARKCPPPCGRPLLIDPIDWQPDGWPQVNGGAGPSSTERLGPIP